MSTTLTNMELENGTGQRLSHLKRIVSGYDRHNQSPAQSLPDRKHRSARGCRRGRRTPQRPDEDLLISLKADSRAVDPSDMTSDDRPMTPNTNNNAGRIGPASPSGGDRVVRATPGAVKRMRALQRECVAVLDRYKEALRVLTDNDVRMREIDAEVKLLGAGAGAVEEEEEEEEDEKEEERTRGLCGGDDAVLSTSIKTAPSRLRLLPPLPRLATFLLVPPPNSSTPSTACRAQERTPVLDMTKTSFFAEPTPDTFHGVKMARGMRIALSASENTKIRAHITPNC
ncbi:hypothetical protein ColTof4_01452 [Colletotrichum tofieldiae]|nr:hypothetical protein ColTof3_08707 [Colletotrichum tofieldiae]GKT69029.1 hypothetical protein ColTof4_01452 [Colletotrichum tofieldiae]GKT96896.1 hypothetical protein Ct61P_14746 [Colletotrichum tofieldiae]